MRRHLASDIDPDHRDAPFLAHEIEDDAERSVMARSLHDEISPLPARQLHDGLDRTARTRVNHLGGPELQRGLTTMANRIDDDNACTHADGRGRRDQTDGAATRDDDGLAGIRAARSPHGVEAAGEGLDKRGGAVIDRIRQLVQPFRTDGEVFAVRAIQGEAEMMDTIRQPDYAFADYALAR